MTNTQKTQNDVVSVSVSIQRQVAEETNNMLMRCVQHGQCYISMHIYYPNEFSKEVFTS